jgi:hypothetical protein
MGNRCEIIRSTRVSLRCSSRPACGLKPQASSPSCAQKPS